MKVQEAIAKINEGCFYSIWEAEEQLDEEAVQVKCDMDIDRHRWYEICTNVWKVEDGFVGIRGVNRLYSEMMSYSDCCVSSEAFEMEEIQIISYKVKK